MKKFFIYVACILGYSCIDVLIRYAGISLGAIPTAILYFATFRLAHYLSQKYCSSNQNKDEN